MNALPKIPVTVGVNASLLGGRPSAHLLIEQVVRRTIRKVDPRLTTGKCYLSISSEAHEIVNGIKLQENDLCLSFKVRWKPTRDSFYLISKRREYSKRTMLLSISPMRECRFPEDLYLNEVSWRGFTTFGEVLIEEFIETIPNGHFYYNEFLTLGCQRWIPKRTEQPKQNLRQWSPLILSQIRETADMQSPRNQAEYKDAIEELHRVGSAQG